MPATKRNEHGLTAKEERFCLRYSTHGIEWRAYVEAFNANEKKSAGWIRTECQKLMRKPEIQARIRHLHLQLEESAIYDHRQCLLEAHEAYLLAQDSGDARGMVAAAQLKAKVSGLIVDKSLSITASVGQMSEEDIRRERERLNDELRALGHPTLPALGAPRSSAEGSRGITIEPEEVR